MKPLVMVGGGKAALPRIIAEAALALGTPLAGYLDAGDGAGPPTTPIPCLGDASRLDDAAFLAAHDLVLASRGPGRRALLDRIAAGGGRLPPLIHPGAIVSPTAAIGEGTILSAGVIVQMDARIGRFCVLNTACTVDHDNVVGDGVSFGPGAHTAGGARVGDGAFIGLGALILNRVTVGRHATVGAGAVVTRDVPDGATVVGNPARVLAK
ncbi:MAG TPA: NeuD/PglB/VioB family sugar acetyltransferase [Caulobacteraceae bacterium]|jgi:acetyltransferase EpsM|nr:NeuD/PglB/VioB family sugar acetyltransferase [Caulobacteraceae bacterium]